MLSASRCMCVKSLRASMRSAAAQARPPLPTTAAPSLARSVFSPMAATRRSTVSIFRCRERRILEYLIANRGRRLNKAQIFSAIYGIFDSEVEENVVESHISKLRKKLREQMGFDPIDSKRFLGYCINIE